MKYVRLVNMVLSITLAAAFFLLDEPPVIWIS